MKIAVLAWDVQDIVSWDVENRQFDEPDWKTNARVR